jgi:hypothetical protein
MELGIVGPGHHQDSDARVEVVDALERFDAPEARHHEVEHHGVGTVALDVEQGLEPVRRLEHVEALHAEGLGEHVPDLRVVVNDQHAHERPSWGVTPRTRRAR